MSSWTRDLTHILCSAPDSGLQSYVAGPKPVPNEKNASRSITNFLCTFSRCLVFGNPGDLTPWRSQDPLLSGEGSEEEIILGTKKPTKMVSIVEIIS